MRCVRCSNVVFDAMRGRLDWQAIATLQIPLGTELMLRLLTYLLRRRRTAISATLVSMTVLSIVGITRLRFDDDLRNAFRNDSAEYREFEQLIEDFGSTDSDCILLIESPDVLSIETLRTTAAIHQDAQEVVGVDHVLSLFSSAPHASMSAEETRVSDDAATSERIRQIAVHRPSVFQQFVSNDRTASIVFVRLESDRTSVSEMEPVLGELDQLLDRRTADTQVTASITGIPSIRRQTVHSTQRDNVRNMLLGVSLAGAICWFMLGRLRATLIVIAGPVTGVVWTLGAMGWVGMELNVLNVVLPPLVLVIGVTDAMHLLLHVRSRIANGNSNSTAAISSVRRFGKACLLTSLTTAVGFGSLVVAQDLIVRSFAVAAAMGTVLTFTAVIFVTPLLSGSKWAISGLTRRRSPKTGLSKLLLKGVGDFLVRWPGAVSMTGVALTIVLCALAVHVRPDFRMLESIDSRSVPYQAMKRCEQHFGGGLVASVVVEWPEGLNHRSPQTLEVLAEVHEVMREHLTTSPPVSLLTFVPNEEAVARTLPRSSQSTSPAASQVIETLVRSDRRRTLVNARVRDEGAAKLAEPVSQTRSKLEDIERGHKGFQLHLTGFPVLSVTRAGPMIGDLRNSLGISMMLILAFIAVAFRSWRIGIISLLPNVLPLLGTAAIMSLLGQPLQYCSVLAFAICLGIAVDDTIHLLARFRSVHRTESDVRCAIRTCLSDVGPAILTTTLLMLVGFGVCVLSESPTIRTFGFYSCVSLVWALLGDLFILPALLVWWYSRSPRCEKSGFAWDRFAFRGPALVSCAVVFAAAFSLAVTLALVSHYRNHAVSADVADVSDETAEPTATVDLPANDNDGVDVRPASESSSKGEAENMVAPAASPSLSILESVSNAVANEANSIRSEVAFNVAGTPHYMLSASSGRMPT